MYSSVLVAVKLIDKQALTLALQICGVLILHTSFVFAELLA